MTANQKFEIVSSAGRIIPVLLALVVMHFSPVPRGIVLRAVISILVPWFALVAYTVFVYNPAGIAAGFETGDHFPAAKFDNNTIASALLGGWLLPSATVCVYLLCRRLVRAQQGAQKGRAEDSARFS